VLSKIKIIFFDTVPTRLLIYILNLKSNYLFTATKIENNVYKLKSKDLELFFVHPRRLFKYKWGIRHRFNELKKKYFLSEIIFNDSDIIVDCGSNIGELPKAIRMDSRKNLTIIAIEPDPVEFYVLQKNLKKTDYSFNKFLSFETGIVQVRYENESGDTHIVTSDHGQLGGKSNIPVLAHSLDSLLAPLNLKSIKLLKIEVEGAEPEVLQGAKSVLKIVDFVALDTGPERGIKNTFNEVNSYLVNHGFKLIRKNYPYSVLFQSVKYRN
jgi:FkbM family methyltransferase